MIPTLNEMGSLPALLASLHGLAQSLEILFVDGGSTDGTVARLQSHGHRVLQTGPGRGYQLAAGAAECHGDVLWFLHADSVVPADAIAAIQGAIRAGTLYGAFSLRFAGNSLSARGMTWFYAWLRRCGLVYGDAGIFVRRDVYEQAGGIPRCALFEDRLLLRTLRKITGDRPGCLPALLTTSSRRFAGWRFPLVFSQWVLLQGLFILGVPPNWLAARYGLRRGGEIEQPPSERPSIENHASQPSASQRERG